MDEKLICEEYQSNLYTNAQIRTKHKLSKYKLYDILRRYGIARKIEIPQYTDEDIKSMVADYRNHIATRTIMKKYNITSYRLYEFLKSDGIDINREEKIKDILDNKFSHIDVDALIAEYQANIIPISVLCEKYKISYDLFDSYITKNSIKESKECRNNVKDSRLIELYKEGKSMHKAAEMCKASPERVKQLLVKENIKIRNMELYNTRYTHNGNYFNRIDTPEKAHILGLLLSDGHIDTKRNTVGIGLQEDDLHIIEYIKRSWNATHNIRCSMRANDKKLNKNGSFSKVKNHYYITVFSRQMVSDISRFDKQVTTTKSYGDFSLPDIDPGLMCHFIRGYFEGDGWITFTIKNDKIFSKRAGLLAQPTMANQIKDIFYNELGIIIKPNLIKNKVNKNSLHSVYISETNNLIKFYHYLYKDANFVMKRKHDKFKKLMILLRDTKGYDVGELYSFDEESRDTEEHGRLPGGENPPEMSPKTDGVDEFTKSNFDSSVSTNTSTYGKYL